MLWTMAAKKGQYIEDTALVLEDGGFAGACNGLSYMSGQKGRAKAGNIDLMDKHHYVGFRYLLTQVCIMDFKLLFEDLPQKSASDYPTRIFPIFGILRRRRFMIATMMNDTVAVAMISTGVVQMPITPSSPSPSRLLICEDTAASTIICERYIPYDAFDIGRMTFS